MGHGLTSSSGAACSSRASFSPDAATSRARSRCAVAATLALSPIVWLHYLVLLLVPLAIARPRFSIVWLLPVLLWSSPRPGYAEGVQTFLPALVAVIIVACSSPARPSSALRRRSRHDDGRTPCARTRVARKSPRVLDRVAAWRRGDVPRRRSSRPPAPAGSPRTSAAATWTLRIRCGQAIRRTRVMTSFDYLYPPALAEVIVPLTVLPDDVSAFLAFAASFATVFGALALVGVRDARCYAAVVIWAPGWNAFEMANVSAVLTLLAAVVWRYRDVAWRSAAALGGPCRSSSSSGPSPCGLPRRGG